MLHFRSNNKNSYTSPKSQLHSCSIAISIDTEFLLRFTFINLIISQSDSFLSSCSYSYSYQTSYSYLFLVHIRLEGESHALTHISIHILLLFLFVIKFMQLFQSQFFFLFMFMCLFVSTFFLATLIAGAILTHVDKLQPRSSSNHCYF